MLSECRRRHSRRHVAHRRRQGYVLEHGAIRVTVRHACIVKSITLVINIFAICCSIILQRRMTTEWRYQTRCSCFGVFLCTRTIASRPYVTTLRLPGASFDIELMMIIGGLRQLKYFRGSAIKSAWDHFLFNMVPVE